MASVSPPPRTRRRTPSPRPAEDERIGGDNDESEGQDGAAAGKRKRSISPVPRDRSASPPSRRRRQSPELTSAPPISLPRVLDVDPYRKRERERQLAERAIDEQVTPGTVAVVKEFDAAAEFAKMVNTRSGGAYVPPAKLRALQEEAAKDKASTEYQRLSWDALRKSINGLINKVNVSNIKHVVPEMFNENLIRGRGLFARSIMKAQASSLPFTPIFAALVAIINTKLPMVGELVLIRLISQFRRAFKRDDKPVCHATSTFIAHLCNQSVAHEIVALQMLVLLLEKPTDDSVEIAVGFMREVGAFLAETSPKANNGVYERFRAVLHEGAIDKRVQYMIEVLFQVRKDKYKDNPAVPEGLDLVEEDEQITHRIALDDELQVQDGLNIFKADPNFLANEEKYAEIKREILGDSDDEDEDEESGSDVSSDGEEDGDVAPNKEGITDMTETNLINLRRTIYLTIMNSLGFEEATHKLLKVQVPEGHEIELCNMVIECCSQERAYSTFYGLIGERFCKINRLWTDNFQEAFQKYYDTIHRYETNKLRNIARFFGHLLASDGISWAVLHVIHMNEEETTSSSRIFVKILLQEVMEEMGIKKMAARFKEADMKEAFSGMFPTDNPKNTRFAINYFTSIGLGVITEDMRTWLQNAPKIIMAQRQAALAAAGEDSSSDSDSDSDDSSDSDTDSDSDSDSDTASSYTRSPSRSRSPPRRRDEAGRSNGRNDDRSLPSKRRRDVTPSPSRSPAPRRSNAKRNHTLSPSRSPPPRRTVKRQYTPSRSPPRRRRDSTEPPSPPASRRRPVDDSPPPPARRRDDDRVNGRDDRRYDDRRDGGRGGRGGDRDDDRQGRSRRDSPPPRR